MNKVLEKYDIPTSSKTAAINFLRKNGETARRFAEEFGFVNSDSRIATKAAQLAAIAIFEEADVASYVKPRLDNYSNYVNSKPQIAEAATAEAATAEAATAEAATAEAATAESATAEAATAEAATAKKRRGRPPLDPSQRKTRRAYVPTGRPRGRPKAPEGTTGYDRSLAWARANGYAGKADSPALRSEIAIGISTNVGIPVGSALAYISRMMKIGALSE